MRSDSKREDPGLATRRQMASFVRRQHYTARPDVKDVLELFLLEHKLPETERARRYRYGADGNKPLLKQWILDVLNSLKLRRTRNADTDNLLTLSYSSASLHIHPLSDNDLYCFTDFPVNEFKIGHGRKDVKCYQTARPRGIFILRWANAAHLEEEVRAVMASMDGVMRVKQHSGRESEWFTFNPKVSGEWILNILKDLVPMLQKKYENLANA